MRASCRHEFVQSVTIVNASAGEGHDAHDQRWRNPCDVLLIKECGHCATGQRRPVPASRRCMERRGIETQPGRLRVS